MFNLMYAMIENEMLRSFKSHLFEDTHMELMESASIFYVAAIRRQSEVNQLGKPVGYCFSW